MITAAGVSGSLSILGLHVSAWTALVATGFFALGLFVHGKWGK
ncbi:MAG TPA: hypothetical protein VGG75_38015 [Trebonia sp.]